MHHKSKTLKEEVAVFQAALDAYPNATKEYYNFSLRRKTNTIVDLDIKLDSLAVDVRLDNEPMIAPCSGVKVDNWLACVELPGTKYIPIHALLCALREFEPEIHTKIVSTLIDMQNASLYSSEDPTAISARATRYVELLKENP